MIGRRAPRRSKALVDREQRGLGVERVEHRLDQQQVDAAVDQAVDRLAVRGNQLVEAHVAKARIVDVGRDRGGPVGRARARRRRSAACRASSRPGVGALARDPRRREIDVAHFRLQPIVGLRDARRVEGVGLDDVGAGLEEGVVDRARRRRAGSAPAGRCRPSDRAHGRRARTPARRESPASSSLLAWIIVPIAPSRMRMRSAAALQQRVLSVVVIGVLSQKFAR